MLVVTGNIFALDNNQTYKLIAKLCDRPNGQLINELTEPPEYMKGSRTLKETMPFNNMLNYGASKGLVQIQEAKTYNGTDPFVVGKPVNVEYNPNQFDEFCPPPGEQDQTLN